MMRSYPIDSDRVNFIATGVVTPVPMWVQLSDGTRRPDPNGRQDVDDQGRALWRVEIITPADPGDERDKSAIVEVLIASNERPQVASLAPISFDSLWMTPGYVKKGTTQPTPSRWSADGVRTGRRAAAPAAA